MYKNDNTSNFDGEYNLCWTTPWGQQLVFVTDQAKARAWSLISCAEMAGEEAAVERALDELRELDQRHLWAQSLQIHTAEAEFENQRQMPIKAEGLIDLLGRQWVILVYPASMGGVVQLMTLDTEHGWLMVGWSDSTFPGGKAEMRRWVRLLS